MKLQGLSVIFCLIVVPVVLILSYYVHAQITTITTQMSYNTKLLDATHDAMSALELNTANENLSSVSDSLRSIIDASTNTFMNSLSTNFGMSNASHSALQPYIPSILYTLYDGYYINAPTRTPVVCSDSTGTVVCVGDDGVKEIPGGVNGDDGIHHRAYHFYQPVEQEDGSPTKYYNAKGVEVHKEPYTVDSDNEEVGMLMYKLEEGDVDDPTYVAAVIEPASSSGTYTKFNTDYVLKSYVPYAARYVSDDGKIDVIVNYTLDNYINVYGYIKGIYYSKSGYLIDLKLIEGESGTKPTADMFKVSDTEVYDFVFGQSGSINLTLHVPNNAGGIEDITIPSETPAECMAIAYYVSAYNFSNWVYTELGNLKNKNVKEYISTINNNAYRGSLALDDDSGYSLIVNFNKNGDQKIFNRDQNPEVVDSDFALHKYNVIKNSIQFNLNLSMSEYNKMSANSYNFEMPVIAEDDWDIITSRVSITTFMQGLSVGLKTYSNYCVVASTNNEFTVIPDQLFYVYKDPTKGEGNIDYHKIDCSALHEPVSADEFKYYESFTSKEVKYDKYYDKNEATNVYDHKYYGCYYCIVNSNYKKDVFGLTEQTYNSNLDPRVLSPNKKVLYYMTLGKERYKVYKTNTIENSQGYEILIPDRDKCIGSTGGDFTFYNSADRKNDGGIVFANNLHGVVIGFENPSTKDINEIKAVEIVVAGTNSPGERDKAVPVVAVSVNINGREGGTDGTTAYNPNDYYEETGTTKKIGLYNLTNNVSNQQTIRIDFKDTLDLYSVTGNLETLYLAFRDRSVPQTTVQMGFILKEVKVIYK